MCFKHVMFQSYLCRVLTGFDAYVIKVAFSKCETVKIKIFVTSVAYGLFNMLQDILRAK